MTDDEIQREIGASMLDFLLDDWGVLESELYGRLDLPGLGSSCRSAPEHRASST
jgi:hypothetical protein